MKRTFIGIVTLMLLGTFCAMAGTQAGKKEIQIQGSLTMSGNSENKDRDTTLMGQIGLNYFLAPQFSFGLASVISSTLSQPEHGDETKFTLLFLMLRADVYLTSGEGSVVPYIGGQAGGVSVVSQSGGGDTQTSTGTAYGGHAGLKIFPTENTSWNVEGAATMYKSDAGGGSSSATRHEYALLVGFSYYF